MNINFKAMEIDNLKFENEFQVKFSAIIIAIMLFIQYSLALVYFGYEMHMQATLSCISLSIIIILALLSIIIPIKRSIMVKSLRKFLIEKDGNAIILEANGVNYLVSFGNIKDETEKKQETI